MCPRQSCSAHRSDINPVLPDCTTILLAKDIPPALPSCNVALLTPEVEPRLIVPVLNGPLAGEAINETLAITPPPVIWVPPVYVFWPLNWTVPPPLTTTAVAPVMPVEPDASENVELELAG